MEIPEESSSKEAEYKLVTILFADIVGSTALGAEIDAEMLKLIMDRCLQRMSEAVDEFGGTVARLMGDGLLAFFGAPRAHEDDPERAALAAERIHSLVEEYAGDVGQPLQVRVGINTGRVVVGELGGNIHGEYTAMGMPVNLAARLESAAGPGGTLVGESTARLIIHRFELESQGKLRLKGFSEPVPAFELVKKRTKAGAEQDLDLVSSPLVGREQEQQQLTSMLQDLEAGRGSLCSLVGEPGIGKSRLLQVTREASADRRMFWAEGRAYSYTQTQPFSVAIDLLLELLGIVGDDSPAIMDLKLERVLGPLLGESVDDVWPFIAVLVGATVPGKYEALVKQLPPPELNIRISTAVKVTIEALAERQPLVLSFEDLHWADESSLGMIQSLMMSTERVPLLMIFLFRPERKKPVWGLKIHAETEFAHRYIELNLMPLGSDASRLLVENLLTVPNFPPSLRKLIQKQAEGNPFFIEELVRDLIERGILIDREGQWELTSEVESLGVPKKVEEVIQARLDRLAPQDRATLQAASVIGRRFSYRLLEKIALSAGFLDALGLVERLLHLQRADMVRERARIPDVEYIFKHALVQETTYRTLLKEGQITFHQLAGEAMEELFSEQLDKYAAQIGRHFEVAGKWDKALDYLLIAGRAAARLASNQEAIVYLKKGLQLLEKLQDSPDNTRRELELLLAIGPPLQLVRGFWDPELKAIYSRARELSKASEVDPQLFFPPLFGLWSYYQFSGEYEISLDLGRQLLAVAEQSQKSMFLIQAHHSMWTTRWMEGSFASLVKHTEKGLALYEPEKHRAQSLIYGGHDPAMCSRGINAIAYCALGFTDQALEWTRASMREAQELPLPFNLSLAHFLAAFHGHVRLDSEMTRNNAERMIEVAEGHFIPFVPIGKLFLGWALVLQANVEEGIKLAVDGIEDIRKIWGGRLQAHSSAVMAEVYKEVGRAADGLIMVEEAMEAAHRTAEHNHLSEIHRIKGDLLLLEDTSDNLVEEQYIRAIEVAQSQKAKFFELRATISLSRLWQRQGRQTEAYDRLNTIYGWFSEGFDTVDLKEAKSLLS